MSLKVAAEPQEPRMIGERVKIFLFPDVGVAQKSEERSHKFISNDEPTFFSNQRNNNTPSTTKTTITCQCLMPRICGIVILPKSPHDRTAAFKAGYISELSARISSQYCCYSSAKTTSSLTDYLTVPQYFNHEQL